MLITEKELDIQRAKAREIFNTLINDYGFNDVIDDEPLWNWEHDNKIDIRELGIGFYCGASRAVLVDEMDHSYVYKFDLCRGEDEIHYCENEAHVYAKSVELNAEAGFCPVVKLLTLNHTNENGKECYMDIYLAPYCQVNGQISEECYGHFFQEYCEEQGYDSENLTSAQREEIGDMIGSYYSDTEGVLEYAAEKWDRDLYTRVCEIIDRYDINDLHTGNWGYLNGHFVITDYAGYSRNICSRSYAA